MQCKEGKAKTKEEGVARTGKVLETYVYFEDNGGVIVRNKEGFIIIGSVAKSVKSYGNGLLLELLVFSKQFLK